MANILIISKQGDGVPLGLRLVDEGHNVDIYIKDSGFERSLLGYKNPRVISKTKIKDVEYDLTLSDMVGLGSLCDELTSSGRLMLSGGSFNDKLELDREYGMKVIKKLTKAKEANTIKVSTKEQLLKELEGGIIPKVIKPLGNKTVDLTLVSCDDENKSLISIVKEWGDKLLPCIVQEMVKGTEISTEGWFNGERFILPFNHTFERKRLMEGDKGPQTGCMGNVVYLSKGDRLTDMILLPLEPLLKKVSYVGPIDVNCIISGDDVYFLEFTTRFGYDAIQTLAELLKVSMFDFLYRVATRQGDLIERTDYYNEIAIGVRLSLPPYPSHAGVDKWKGVQVLSLEEGAKKHVWLSDVMKQDSVEVVAGVDGVIGCVTARGTTVRECQRRVYRTVNNIVICKDVQYREDIGDDAIASKEEFDRWCNANNE